VGVKIVVMDSILPFMLLFWDLSPPFPHFKTILCRECYIFLRKAIAVTTTDIHVIMAYRPVARQTK
jgi:hypothetical protein